jgi:trans-2,3-dihydro-3-hydroxyanthranilate isomerase
VHGYTLLDVFTDTPLTGNGLAVVADADDLSDAAMLAFARETRLSETTYVQSATEAGADYRNRIWTTAGELPFAGHPSLGTAFAVARWGGEDEASFVQQTPAGLQPIDVTVGDGAGSATMLQEPAVFGGQVAAARVLEALGLGAGDEHPELPAQFVSTGVPQLMFPVADVSVLSRIEPDYGLIGPLLGAAEAIVLYAAHVDADAGRASARAYCFTSAMGEDPATGSAAGPLMAYTARRLGLDRLTIAQGVEMGRASELRCAVDGERVSVAGDIVVVADGTVTF